MTHSHKYYAHIKVKKLKGSEVEIEGAIPAEVIKDHESHILEEMKKDFSAPGFRKGHVPMNIFMQNVNEMAILSEAAELALNAAYPEIVHNEKIEIFGKPRITLTKLVPKNPVEFKIRVGTIPEVRLPNYKKIAGKIMENMEPSTVSEEEINDVVKQIKQMRATKDPASQAIAGQDNHGASAKIAMDSGIELTDEYVKGLGDFKDVADFKAKIRENLQKDKENLIWKKKREEIIKNLIDNAEVTLPAIVVEDEAEAIRERFHANLEAKSLDKDEYLKKLGKSEEEIHKADIAHIEQELKLRLILDKIAEVEKIEVTDEEVEKEMEFMQSRHPEADPEQLRNYIRAILKNEKLLRTLEGRKALPPRETQ